MRILSVVIIAAWLAASAAAPAHADPITAAVGTFITFLGSSTVAAAIARIAITVGLSYLATVLRSKAPKSNIGGVSGTLGTGDTVPHSIVIGRGVADASLNYANTYGSDGGTPNAKFVQVIELANLPGHDLAEIWLNGERLTWDPDATPGTEGIAIPEYTTGGTEHLWVRYYDGTQIAADSRLVSLFASDSDRPYQSTRIGKGICYVVVTALIDEKLFSSFPQCTFVLDNFPLYDRREDSTAGGDGDQRADDADTWAASANAIVGVENVVRGLRYPDGSWAYGGQTTADGQLPAASWFTGANECDAAINLAGGGTEPQFTIGGCIRFSDAPADVIEEMLKACNGRLAEIGGIYKVRAGAPGSAVFSFTDADILSTEAQTFAPFPSLSATINGVTAKYISPDEGWAEKDAPPLYSGTLEDEDGGRRQAADVRYGLVTSGTQTQRLMKAEIASERAFRKHALPMPFEAFVLEPLDVVAFGSDRNGYDTDKAFDVEAVDDLPGFNVNINIKEVDPNAYDWDEGTDEVTIVNGPLARLTTPSQAIVDWAVAGVTVSGDGGRARPGLRLSWNVNVEDVNGVQFQVRLASDASLVLAGETDGWDLGRLDITQNLVSNTQYEARGRYRPISARDTTWSSWLPATTPDVGFDESELNATLDALLDQLRITAQASLAAALEDIRAEIEQLAADNGGVYAVSEARLNTIINAVGERVGSNEARVTVLQSAVATLDSAIAQFLVGLYADNGDGTATVNFRLNAAALPEGALAAAALELMAGNGGSWADAALTMAAYFSEEDGYYSKITLKAGNILLETPEGTTLDALLFTTAGDPKEVLIDGSGTITPDLSSRQTVYQTTLNQNATMGPPSGAKPGFSYVHIVEQDDTGGWTLTYDDKYLVPQPSISTLAGVKNIIQNIVLTTNPMRISSTLQNSVSETPILQLRDHVGAANTTGGAIDLSSLDIEPGDLLVAVGHAWGESNGSGVGALTAAAIPDWDTIASDTDFWGSVVGRVCVHAAMKIADGTETSLQLFSFTNPGNKYVSVQIFSFSILGGSAEAADGEADATNNLPTFSHTINAAGIDGPLLAFSFAGVSGPWISGGGGPVLPNQSFSETADGDYSENSNNYIKSRVKFRLYDESSSPVDVTASYTASTTRPGSSNNTAGTLATFYIHL